MLDLRHLGNERVCVSSSFALVVKFNHDYACLSKIDDVDSLNPMFVDHLESIMFVKHKREFSLNIP